MISKKLINLSIILFLIITLFTNCNSNKNVNNGKDIVLRLGPSEGNPRNSEGDFIQLKNGKILFVYTFFTEGTFISTDHCLTT